jgi:hypothetical protein
MIKRYHLPAILFFLITTSLTLIAQKSVYTFPFENNYRLPPMETLINADEIATTYQTMGNLYTTEITGLGEETMEQTSSTFVSDINAIDAIRFLKFYMEEQLVAPGDQTSGSVEMSIIYYNKRSRVNLGTALNVLTLGLGTFLGIPFSTGITDVEVEASFFDASNQYIVSHRGVGQSKKLESLYNISSASRVPHQKALKRALEDLNEHIMADPLISKSPVEPSIP